MCLDTRAIRLTQSIADQLTEKIHPQNAEANSLPYRPSTVGVTSKDRGTAVVETVVARGSHLLSS